MVPQIPFVLLIWLTVFSRTGRYAFENEQLRWALGANVKRYKYSIAKPKLIVFCKSRFNIDAVPLQLFCGATAANAFCSVTAKDAVGLQ